MAGSTNPQPPADSGRGLGVPCSLYRFYDSDDRLLYVGITISPAVRFVDHRRGQGWWSDVARIDIEWHPDRDAALGAEKSAILGEEPLHNVIHNGRRGRGDLSDADFEDLRRIKGWLRIAPIDIVVLAGKISDNVTHPDEAQPALEFLRTLVTIGTLGERDHPGTCPICGKAASYLTDSDRFFHQDGSSNQNCWWQFGRDDRTRWQPW